MAVEIENEDRKVFLLSSIVVFTDKVIKQEYAAEITRLISMTKVGKLFEEEKVNYAKEQQIHLLIGMIDRGTII